ncbi:protein MAINTENANCE OF PSII UNDER HIGH LIGHT 1 [Nymphaea colorata]|nr:protein MAINTENANCE OF PSII UNDER HIGH LIGHT 1 [Nymphaea colorata]
MAACSQSMISASTSFLPTCRIRRRTQRLRGSGFYASVKASSEQDADCNEEDCAPEKEVGKVSVEWLASERTKVSGTYPPLRKKGWTGYVEKDTAGQTNIYSVEPTVYVAESVISSGSAGSSADGTENTAAIVAGLGLISIAAASSVLLQVGKGTPDVKTTEYSGPSLSYYINKFKQPEIIEASIPAQPQTAPTPEVEESVVAGESQLQALTPTQEQASTVSQLS